MSDDAEQFNVARSESIGPPKRHILDLPPEIRLMIFRFAIHPHATSIEAKFLEGFAPFGILQASGSTELCYFEMMSVPAPGPGIALLLVCRKFYDEAFPLLYDHELFTIIPKPRRIRRWNNAPLPAVRSAFCEPLADRLIFIRHLALDGGYILDAGLEQVLARHFPNLHTLQIYKVTPQSDRRVSFRGGAQRSCWISGACRELLLAALTTVKCYPLLEFSKWADWCLFQHDSTEELGITYWRLISVTMSRHSKLQRHDDGLLDLKLVDQLPLEDPSAWDRYTTEHQPCITDFCSATRDDCHVLVTKVPRNRPLSLMGYTMDESIAAKPRPE